jgi:hypothetical protein
VRISAPNEPKDETPPEKESEARNELYERAMKDPMVRGFVETFQGEVEDVRPLNTGSETKPGNTKR